MPNFQVTIRLRTPGVRYHTLELSAPDLVQALRDAADALTPDVSQAADLAEIRIRPDPESRDFLGE